MKKSLGKRLISGVTSALLAVATFAQAVPLGEIGLLKARAATNLGNQQEVDDVTLLVGESPSAPDGSKYPKFASVDEAINQYAKDYALGIASQFSVFLNGDFKPYNSDAEGRMAVGGSVNAGEIGWEYAFGKGHFWSNEHMNEFGASVNGIKLEKLIENDGFAHLIWQGKDGSIISKLYMTDSYDDSGNTNYSSSDKKIVVQEDAGKSVIESSFPDHKDKIYQANLIDFQEQFDATNGMLQSRSSSLLAKKDQFTTSYDKDSATLTLTWNGAKDAIAETVFCTLDAKELEQFKYARNIQFVDVPQLPTPINVIDPQKDGSIKKVEWKNSYIVINIDVEEGTEVHLGVTQSSPDVTNNNFSPSNEAYQNKVTYINNINISSGTFDAENLKIPNNHYGVKSLLYNIPKAKKVILAGNFQGTILAPNAKITDEKTESGNEKNDWPHNNAHISGAVIADSFEGCIEFGYRPFTGPISMLGASSGYHTEFKKINSLGGAVSGAEIGIFDKDNINDPVSTFTSDENGIVTLTFGGDTPDAAGTVTKNYFIKEVKAPDSYKVSDEKYFFDVTETFREYNGSEDLVILPESASVTMYGVSAGNATEPDPAAESITYDVSYKYTLDENDEVTKIECTIGDDTYTVTKDNSGKWAVTETVKDAHFFDEKTGLVYPKLVPPGVEEGKNPTITDKEEVWIEKVDAKTGTRLEGAELSIEGVSESFASSVEDYQKFTVGTDIAVGEVYKLSEIKVPDGYKKAADIFFKVEEENNEYVLYTGSSETNLVKSDKRVISMADEELGIVGIIKYDTSVDIKPGMLPASLKGAELTIIKLNDSAFGEGKLNSETTVKLTDLDAADYEVITTITTGDEEIFLDELKTPGTYAIVETKVPEAEPTTNPGGGPQQQGYSKDAVNVVNVFTVKEDGSAVDARMVVIEKTVTGNAPIDSKDANGVSWIEDRKLIKIEPTYSGLLYGIDLYTKNNQEAKYNWGGKAPDSSSTEEVDGKYVTHFVYNNGITAADLAGSEGQIQFHDGNYGTGDNSNLTGEYALYFKEIKSEKVASHEKFELKESTRSNGKTVYNFTLGNSQGNNYTYTLKFKKLDETGKTISNTTGMEFALYKADANGDPDGAALYTWDSASKDIPVLAWNNSNSLQKGTYVIREESAPKHYARADDLYLKINTNRGIWGEMFQSAEIGTSLDNLKKVDIPMYSWDINVSVQDELITTDVNFSKKALSVAGDELAGAELTLTGLDDNNAVITFNKDDLKLGTDAEYIKTENEDTTALTALKWKSGSTPTTITLKDGKYTLQEIAAPYGFAKATSIKFEILNGAIVKIDNKDVTEATSTITMVDEEQAAEVKFAKLGEKGEALAGATLSLKGNDPNGNAILINGKEEYTWTSTDEAVTLKLKDGKYVYSEVKAPDGYVKAEPIEFEIKDGLVVGGVNTVIPPVSDPDAVVYSKPYTISNILTDYSVFVSGDLWNTKDAVYVKDYLKTDYDKSNVTGPIHIVGAIAVGGTCRVGNFGDVSVDNSYVENLWFGNGNYNNSQHSYKLYYGSLHEESKELNDEDAKKIIQNPGYINFASAFASLSAESKRIADSSETVGESAYDEETKTINIDISKFSGKKIAIPYELLEKSAEANNGDATLNIINEKNIHDFQKEGYKFSFVGINNNNISITYPYFATDTPIEQSLNVKLKYNDKTYADAAGTTSDSNLGGVNLLWNFPDATGIIRSVTPTGHYVAPNADVVFTKNGHCATAFIAKSLYAGNEIHYHPYIGTETENDPIPNGNTYTLVNKKSQISVNKFDLTGEKELAGAELTITLDDEDKAFNKDVITSNNEIEIADKTITFKSKIDSSTVIKGLPDGNYTLTEKADNIEAESGVKYEAISEWKFEIKNGNVVAKAELTDKDKENSYVENTENDIKVFDKAVNDEKSVISISKNDIADETNKEIAGADIQITLDKGEFDSTVIECENETFKIDGNKITFTSGTEATVIKGLPDGTYTFEETNAPGGFEKVESTWKFTIEDGKITTTDKVEDTTKSHITNEGNHIIVNDKKTEFSISKNDIADETNKEIQGADIKITLENGEFDSTVIECENETFKIDGNEITFTSGTEATVIKGLPNGTYTFEETVAPEGFEKVESTWKFTIEDGKITTTDKVEDATKSHITNEGNHIIVNDKQIVPEKPVISISKQDAYNSSEVEGAEITITGAEDFTADEIVIKRTINGEEVILKEAENEKIGENEYKIEGNTITFVSSGEASTVIEGLKDGSYTIEEVTAPDGYYLSTTSSVEVKITEGKVEGNSNVVIKDNKQLKLSKLDFGGKPVKGAAMEFVLVATETDGENIVLSNAPTGFKPIEWISDTSANGSAIVTEGNKPLADGFYRLRETIAPDGHTLITDVYAQIEKGRVVKLFALGENNTLVALTSDKITSDSENNIIVVQDEASILNISKQIVGGSTEIDGAKLQIKLIEADEADADLSNVMVSQGGNVLDEKVEGFEKTNTTIDFLSTNKYTEEEGNDTIITGLPDGSYELSEVLVPQDEEGNDKFVQAEVIKFTIVNGKVSKVEYTEADAGNYGEEDSNESRIVMRDGTTTTTTVTTTSSTSTSTSTVTETETETATQTEPTTTSSTSITTTITNTTSTSTSTTTTKTNTTSTSTTTTTSKTTTSSTSTTATTSKTTTSSTSTTTTTTKTTSTSTTTTTTKTTSTSTSTTTTTTKTTSTSTTTTKTTSTSTTTTTTKTTSTSTTTTTTKTTSTSTTTTTTKTTSTSTTTTTTKTTSTSTTTTTTKTTSTSTTTTTTKTTSTSTTTTTTKPTTTSTTTTTTKTTSTSTTTTTTKTTSTSTTTTKTTSTSTTTTTTTTKTTSTTTTTTKTTSTSTTTTTTKTTSTSTITTTTKTTSTSTTTTTTKTTSTSTTTTTTKTTSTSTTTTTTKTTSTSTITTTTKTTSTSTTTTTTKTTSTSTTTTTTKTTSTSTTTTTTKTTSTSTTTTTTKTTSTSTTTTTTKTTSTSTTTTTTKTTSTSTTTTTTKTTSTSTTTTTTKPTTTSTTTTTTKTTSTSTTTNPEAVLPGDDTRTTTKNTNDDWDLDIRTKTTTSTTTATETTTTETTTTTVLADINISKQDIYGTEVAGATLTLTGTDSEGNEISFSRDNVVFGNGSEFVGDGTSLEWISGNEATFIKNLPDGSYLLHEVAAPDGYEVATDINFTIENGELKGIDGNTVVMVDTKLGEIEISKRNVFGDEISGAELTITGKDDNGNDIVFDVEDIILGTNAQLITEENGSELRWLSGSTSTFIKNLPDGTYVLHEVAAPNGYKVTTDITFTVSNGQITEGTNVTGNTVTMIDDMILTDVSISKDNVFGKEIPGAKLTLTGTDLTGRTVEFSAENVEFGTDVEFVSDGNNLTWISGTTSTLVKNLPDGTYVLHEVAAPNGYEVTTDITFTITNGEVSGEIGVDSNSVTMTDDMIKTNVQISKENVFGQEIAGATLTLTGVDFNGNKVQFTVNDVALGEGAEFISGGDTLTFISGTTSTFIKDLPDGTYVLHEVAAPNGYEVATDITFTINNGQLTGETGVDSDSVTMTDDTTLTDVQISKENVFGDEIAGATLTLTGIDFNGNKVQFTVDDVVPGKDGKFVSGGDSLTFVSGTTSTLVKDLPDGTYVLHEVAAPNGYEVTTDITFTITNGVVTGEVGVESDSVTMTDDMIKTDVQISKENVFGDEIAGATLTLTGVDFNGSKVQFTEKNVEFGKDAKFVSDGDSLTFVSGTTSTLVKDLPDGTYVLHEVAAPNGYEVATDIIFTIENGKITGQVGVSSDSVTMTDEMTTTDVTVSKQDTVGKEIAGATLTLTGKDFNGNEVVFDITNVTLGEGAKLVSTENGNELTWISGTTPTLVNGLTDGTYVLHEVAAPNGYEVATDITFTIENGVVTGVTGVEGSTVTMIDETTPAVTTTTTTKKTTTTTKKTTTTTSKKTDAPKTGVAGVTLPIVVLAAAAVMATASRKRREDEE